MNDFVAITDDGATPADAPQTQSSPALTQPTKHTAQHSADALTNIYEGGTNISVWQRNLSPTLIKEVQQFVADNPRHQSSMIVSAATAFDAISETLGEPGIAPKLSEDIALLVDMFCCLFDLKYAGLRLTVLNKAMCPRFHVDRVPMRLVTTYQGPGSEWLPHSAVDRTKLGLGNQGLPDEKSGLFNSVKDIQGLNAGDVALLKGELWPNNENAGLVHRSPVITSASPRLLLTLDFSDD